MRDKSSMTRRAMPKRAALVAALAVGFGMTGLAFGQATTGSIFGAAPAQPNESVHVVNRSGVTRTVTVTNGTYTLRGLPAGTYTVSLLRDGEVVSTRANVTVQVGGGVQVNFQGAAAGAQNLGSVQVVASAMPSIDVSSVSNSFTIDSQQLSKLPLGHSMIDIALLAPSVVSGSPYFGGLSIGGAGVTENAYYVNGYNVGGMYANIAVTYSLPYGAIALQQTQTGGFGAKYGRSDGGIINQIGKSGTNQWHFGARVQWVPRSLRAGPRDTYIPHHTLTDTFGQEKFNTDVIKDGELYQYRNENKGWNFTKSVSIGGPLVKDKLFIYLAGEQSTSTDKDVASVLTQQVTFSKSHSMKWYAKVNWNISDNNLFEYTKLRQNERNGYGTTYTWDNETHTSGVNLGDTTYGVNDLDSDIFQYTGFLSDRATIKVLYGRTTLINPTIDPNASPLPFIGGWSSRNTDIVPDTPANNAQPNNQLVSSSTSPDEQQRSNGLRVDFSYRLGDHLLQAGIDNNHYWIENAGARRSGEGQFEWVYHSGNPDDAITTQLGVGAPHSPYYVEKLIETFTTSMGARQQAWYVEDNWQVMPNVLLNLGLRNDSYKNFNSDGVTFINQSGQWEPRLGVSWDVNGDSSFKIYANAGRYFLALPAGAAFRTATASTYTSQYFTYTGIDENGEPTGLKPVPVWNPATKSNGTAPSGPVSRNGEFGVAPDPDMVAATNLKPQYQDTFVLGFDKKLGENWVYGAKATYRTLGTLVDDGCYGEAVTEAVEKAGYDPSEFDIGNAACLSVNPNRTNDINVKSLDGTRMINVPVTQAETKLPNAQRDYYSLLLYLEHPFDGTWMGRINYTFSRNWGNAEGQVRSDFGQGGPGGVVAATEDWDYWQLMSGARGYLPNHRRHLITAYGAWAITPEWMLSGSLRIASGHRKECLGFFGPTPGDPSTNNPGGAYGSDYHWCEGKISPPGQEMMRWSNQLNLGITYSPTFADHHLKFKMYIFNVLNSQVPLQLMPHRFARGDRVVLRTYKMPIAYQDPRYFRFTISYDY